VQVSFTDAFIFNPGAGASGVPGLMSFGLGPWVPPPPTRTSGLVGGIVEWGAAAAPAGWLLCDGTLYAQAAQAALFAVTGNIYNQVGDPAGWFRVPDCRGRIVFGAGSNLALGANDGLAEAARNPTTHGHAGNLGYDVTPVDAFGNPLVLDHVWSADTGLMPFQSTQCDPGATSVAEGHNDPFNPGAHGHSLAGASGTGWGGSHSAADLSHAHPDGGTLNNRANWPSHLGLNYIIFAG
jgi:hypothetical protein